MSAQAAKPAQKQSRPQPRGPRRVRQRGWWWPYVIGAGVLLAVASFLFVLRGGGTPGRTMSSSGLGAAIGAEAPTTPMPATTGGEVSLADYRGSKLVVFFYESGG